MELYFLSDRCNLTLRHDLLVATDDLSASQVPMDIRPPSDFLIPQESKLSQVLTNLDMEDSLGLSWLSVHDDLSRVWPAFSPLVCPASLGGAVELAGEGWNWPVSGIRSLERQPLSSCCLSPTSSFGQDDALCRRVPCRSFPSACSRFLCPFCSSSNWVLKPAPRAYPGFGHGYDESAGPQAGNPGKSMHDVHRNGSSLRMDEGSKCGFPESVRPLPHRWPWVVAPVLQNLRCSCPISILAGHLCAIEVRSYPWRRDTLSFVKCLKALLAS